MEYGSVLLRHGERNSAQLSEVEPCEQCCALLRECVYRGLYLFIS
jgi:hypothetical protein